MLRCPRWLFLLNITLLSWDDVLTFLAQRDKTLILNEWIWIFIHSLKVLTLMLIQCGSVRGRPVRCGYHNALHPPTHCWASDFSLFFSLVSVFLRVSRKEAYSRQTQSEPGMCEEGSWVCAVKAESERGAELSVIELYSNDVTRSTFKDQYLQSSLICKR